MQGLNSDCGESTGYGDGVEGKGYIYSSVCGNLGLILLVVNSIIQVLFPADLLRYICHQFTYIDWVTTIDLKCFHPSPPTGRGLSLVSHHSQLSCSTLGPRQLPLLSLILLCFVLRHSVVLASWQLAM